MKIMLLVLMTFGLFAAENASAVMDPGFMTSCHFEKLNLDNDGNYSASPLFFCICPYVDVPFGDGDWDMGGGEHTAEFDKCFNAPVSR